MENLNNLNQYFSRNLNLESPNLSPDSNSSSIWSSPPFYNPSCLLDLNWNDGDNDIFMLNMFKKYLGDYEENQISPPPSMKSEDQESDYGFLTVPSPQNFNNNVTECVTVPSSKHVAQILGKKGSKIRALRATTNTYIRSPLPNEEPVFIIKGRKPNVLEAVKALKSASEFFSTLEGEKEKAHDTAVSCSRGDAIVVKFSIPEQFVGLVVGVKGATIKEIEKQTKTYIQSPSMDTLPTFTITGSPENCEKSMHLISRYLSVRGVGPGSVIDLSFSPEMFCPGPADYYFAWIPLNSN